MGPRNQSASRREGVTSRMAGRVRRWITATGQSRAENNVFVSRANQENQQAEGGEGRHFQGERRTVASRPPDPQRWCPCNPGSRRARGCLVLLSRLRPGASRRSGCSPSPSTLRECRLWAPSLLPAFCAADPRCARNRRPRSQTGEAAAGHYPTLRSKVATFKPFCPLPGARPRVKSPVRSP